MKRAVIGVIAITFIVVFGFYGIIVDKEYETNDINSDRLNDAYIVEIISKDFVYKSVIERYYQKYGVGFHYVYGGNIDFAPFFLKYDLHISPYSLTRLVSDLDAYQVYSTTDVNYYAITSDFIEKVYEKMDGHIYDGYYYPVSYIKYSNVDNMCSCLLCYVGDAGFNLDHYFVDDFRNIIYYREISY